MLIPRISLRRMLAITSLCAVVFLMARFARHGEHWAVAIVVACIAAIILLVLFSLLFGIAYLLARFVPLGRRDGELSPFASDRLPPQIVPPRDESTF
jgi:hypothetical protein